MAENIRWRAELSDKYFEMTINLAKPEIDNKETAKLLKKNKMISIQVVRFV